MRLVQFHRRGKEGVANTRVGVEQQEGGGVVDLNAFDPSLPSTMRGFLETGERGMETARRAVASGQCVVPRADLTLLAPITAPDKVVCVGMNYRDHCLEQRAPVPTEPIIFSKFPSAIVGPYDNVTHPAESQEVDWEVELAFVIGRTGKHIKVGGWLVRLQQIAACQGFYPKQLWISAHGHSQGDSHRCTRRVATSITARSTPIVFLGRGVIRSSSDRPRCFPDPHNLGIRCRVNSSVVQDSNTNQMIFKTQALVAWVSQFVTLFPGDVFLTGTPPGVGVFRKPPVFLKKGDVVECEIDEIGLIRNTVV
nr:PREDICTED: fumarylacetoacetate hydrolase domain-containing protein 2A [Lepisosteus oculatus]